jgi:hypothetical protein
VRASSLRRIIVVLTILFIVAGVLFKLPEPEIRAKVVRGIFLVIACGSLRYKSLILLVSPLGVP